ncbi:DUF167 domain-containing protein [Candidatus Pacearchaeota archaeon]|nr:DUF167 domain-containing protein [Candidatus Pacearchaeota archaeon]
MKIKVKVHANSSQEKINKINDKSYEVWIREKPIEGKANAYLIKMLKKYFKEEVKLISGHMGKNKIFEIKL